MTKYKIKALIYDKRNRILSIGENSYIKTHPRQAASALAVGEPSKVFLHAEIAALVRLKDFSKAYKIVVIRFNKLGKPAPAYPCKCCLHALKLAGITKIEST